MIHTELLDQAAHSESRGEDYRISFSSIYRQSMLLLFSLSAQQIYGLFE